MSLTSGSVTDVRTATGTGGIPINCDVLPLDGGNKVLNILNDNGFNFSKGDHVLYDTDTNQIEGIFSKSPVNNSMSSFLSKQNNYIVINYPNGMSIHVPI
jgi:hypothetical protein